MENYELGYEYAPDTEAAKVAKNGSNLLNSHARNRTEITNISGLEADVENYIRRVRERSIEDTMNIETTYNKPRRNTSIFLPFDGAHNAQWLNDIYKKEITDRLLHTDIFETRNFNKLITSAKNDESFIKACSNGVQLIHPHELSLIGGARWGMRYEDVEWAKKILDQKHHPFHFLISPAHAGSIAIFSHLKNAVKANIVFDTHFAHSVEIANSALKSNFTSSVDGFTLTLATAATIMSQNRCEYTACFMMPSMSHGMLSPASKNGKKNRNGNYYLMKDTPSSELYLFNDCLSSR